MIIGIDANEANTKERVGVHRFSFELLKNLYKLQAINKNNANPIKYILYLKEKPLSDMPTENNNWQYKVIPSKFLWIITKLTPHLFKNPEKVDVFFTPSHYLPPFLTVPAVCSIMDLGYLEFSGQFRKKDFWQLKFWSARSISISKYIISISNSTKRDIVRHYPKAKDKVVVAYPSYEKNIYDRNVSKDKIKAARKRHTIVGDYVLFLSTLKPSKNVEGLIDAFSLLKGKKEIKKPLKLVIAGKKGWLYEEIFAKVKELGLEKDIVFTGFIEEELKPALIKGAKAFVLPSYWEGFGLDPLYAMALGVPVIVSDRGSLPEVVGDAGFIIDPNKPDEIAEKMEKVLSMDKNEYNNITRREKAQVKKFSWVKTAEKVQKTLIKAVEN